MGKAAIHTTNPGEVGQHHKPRVLIIDNSVSISGAYRSILASVEKLTGQFDFYFAVPKGIWSEVPFSAQQIHWFQYLEVQKGWRVINYLPKLLANSLRASKLIRANGITIVHVNDMYNMMGILLKLFHPRLRLVYHVRLIQDSYAKPVYRIWRYLIKKMANQVLCVSQRVLKDIGAGATTRLIYDSLPEEWLLNESYQMPAIPEVKALYVGNYIPGKGQDLALDALAEAVKEVPELRLKFLGSITKSSDSKSFLNRLKTKTAKQNLEHYVTFAGYSEHVRQEILGSHFIVNFSESESFSMTCLESLACRRPVIVTDCGGPAEVVRDGINGLLVPNRNISSMSNALIRMASDADLRLKFSKNAQIDFKDKFNIQQLSEQLSRVYTGTDH